MKEYKDWKAAGNGKKEDFEAKEKGWKETLEEIFSSQNLKEMPAPMDKILERELKKDKN